MGLLTLFCTMKLCILSSLFIKRVGQPDLLTGLRNTAESDVTMEKSYIAIYEVLKLCSMSGNNKTELTQHTTPSDTANRCLCLLKKTVTRFQTHHIVFVLKLFTMIRPHLFTCVEKCVLIVFQLFFKHTPHTVTVYKHIHHIHDYDCVQKYSLCLKH